MEALVAAYRSECGNPGRMPIQATVFTARK
jgi:hypothetical protein